MDGLSYTKSLETGVAPLLGQVDHLANTCSLETGVPPATAPHNQSGQQSSLASMLVRRSEACISPPRATSMSANPSPQDAAAQQETMDGLSYTKSLETGVAPLLGQVDHLANTCSLETGVPPATDQDGQHQHQSQLVTTWIRGVRIGAGSQGDVFEARDNSTGRSFAVKEARLPSQRVADQMKKEISILSSLKHPNIVSFLGSDVIDDRIYIYLEYMPCGSLATVLRQFGPLEGDQLWTSALGCMKGLDYLHNCSPPVVHRDIKCANVLVDTSFCVKLSDFGCSKHSWETQTNTAYGSIPWMAPEVIIDNPDSGGYGRKADIWSFGCTVLEMATAEKPWGRNVLQQDFLLVVCHIASDPNLPDIHEWVPDWCRELIELCVRRAPDTRPDTRQLLGTFATRWEG